MSRPLYYLSTLFSNWMCKSMSCLQNLICGSMSLLLLAIIKLKQYHFTSVKYHSGYFYLLYRVHLATDGNRTHKSQGEFRWNQITDYRVTFDRQTLSKSSTPETFECWLQTSILKSTTPLPYYRCHGPHFTIYIEHDNLLSRKFKC